MLLLFDHSLSLPQPGIPRNILATSLSPGFDRPHLLHLPLTSWKGCIALCSAELPCLLLYCSLPFCLFVLRSEVRNQESEICSYITIYLPT